MKHNDPYFTSLPIFQCCNVENNESVYYSIKRSCQSFVLKREAVIVAAFTTYDAAYNYFFAEFN